MSSTGLLQPILADGIPSVNFFTGRLLSAQDLQQQAESGQEADRRLARSLGDGIAWGLEVAAASNNPTDPTVVVQGGQAVTRDGRVLTLSCATTLSLVQQAAVTTVAKPPSCISFSPCGGQAANTFVAGAGIYLLTISPAVGYQGKAPVNGSSPGACNTQYNIDGVQFRLIALPNFTATDLADKRLRNQLAYKCFGPEGPAGFFANPFGPPATSYGLLDTLRPKLLTDCDVPLAVLYWAGGAGLQFIDLWSVRRRITGPSNAGNWAPAASDRRRAEGEAMFLQFQAQIADMQRLGKTQATLSATQLFATLPPVGLLPLQPLSGQTGFTQKAFFSNLTYREPVFIEEARVGSLIRSALDYPPLDLSSGEFLWLYRVRENQQLIEQTGKTTTQPYLIFTTGQMPFVGEARFDVSRWDYSNYV